MYLMSAVFRGSYGALIIRDQRTRQIPFGRKRSRNRSPQGKSFNKVETIGSAVQSAALENFSVFEMAER